MRSAGVGGAVLPRKNSSGSTSTSLVDAAGRRPGRSRRSGRRPRAPGGSCSRRTRATRRAAASRSPATGVHFTSSNLSAPRLAIVLESSAWSAARKFTQNLPERWISGQAREVLAGTNSTSGGSSETLENDWQVIPTGSSLLIDGHHGDAGGEPAEHVAEPAGGGDGLRVVVDGDVLAGPELEVELLVAEPGVDQLGARPGLPGVGAHPLRDVAARPPSVMPCSLSLASRRRSRGPSTRPRSTRGRPSGRRRPCRPSVPNSTSKPPGDFT